MSEHSATSFSRRAFLRGSGVAAAASTTIATATGQQPQRPRVAFAGETTITLTVNGKQVTATVEPRTTLLEVLRYQLDVTGPKPVSSDGTSGASTVLVDGKPVMASSTLALTVAGKQVTTSEGLANDEVVQAFVDHDGQQCGFCTPGFVVAVRAFLNEHPDATEEEIRASLNGNICRCGTYANVLQAVLSLVKGSKDG